MKTYFGVAQLPAPVEASAVTIGNFDGLHSGHREIMQRLKDSAQSLGVLSAVVTFDPHPVQVLYPERALARLFDLQDLQEQLSQQGVDLLIVEPFSREFAALDPKVYLRDWVVRPLGLRKLLVGYDFSFGRQRSGNLQLLAELGQSLGFDLEVVTAVQGEGGEVVSSSRIRKALAQGQVERAAEMLQRPFSVRGFVERGQGRGRSLGFPTANLQITSQTLPQKGVYICRAWRKGKKFAALTNIGVNPTFAAQGSEQLKVETHLWDWPQDRDLYGEEVKLEFLHRLRDEEKFSGPLALREALEKDLKEAKSWWGAKH